MYKGSMVALITPMQQDGEIDFPALQELVAWHLAEKTDALVIIGTTGEGATLNNNEQKRIISRVVQQVNKRVPVIVGTGTNATRTTIELTQQAKALGADAALVVTPYYNKPTQAGLYHHYKTVVDETDFPILLYNVPSRTACDLLPETVEELSRLTQIIGIKEATGDVKRAIEIKSRCEPNFAIYSGDDLSAIQLYEENCIQGVISVTANIVPYKMHCFCTAGNAGRYAEANAIHTELASLHKNLFLESNPIPTKWALKMLGKIQDGIRLPLLPLDNRYHDEVKKAMQKAGVK